MNWLVLAYLGGVLTALILRSAFRKSSAPVAVDEGGHWCFPMDTLAQMMAIPVERRERFLAELPLMFRRTWELSDKYPFKTTRGCVWVDDGLGELRPIVKNAPDGVGDAFAARKLELDTPESAS